MSNRSYRRVRALLSALDLLPLEECTQDADEWRREIADTIRELDSGLRLPDNDSLRFDREGNRVSEEMLAARLEELINSWPSWEKERKKLGWKKTYKKRRKTA